RERRANCLLQAEDGIRLGGWNEETPTPRSCKRFQSSGHGGVQHALSNRWKPPAASRRSSSATRLLARDPSVRGRQKQNDLDDVQPRTSTLPKALEFFHSHPTV